MFANLKNKLIEEVKASPSKFQQFANAAQAAVSSTSNTTTESNTTAATNENFFSITEEDTPQNSPYKPLKLPTGGRSSTPQSLSNGAGARTRRLSNSSMASDVSFRWPSYEPSATPYHMQSDLDVSGSEMDDTASTAKLDVVSKEQLYNAYRKSLDRYQKYRSRYTDLAKKFKDLERDSTKARSVLVETQEKAIRRISELREQCSLEQQAKAHLEEALRMEMDDMHCKMQAYQTKLKLLGQNPDQITTSSTLSESLIDLDSTTITQQTSSNSDDYGSAVLRIEQLENELQARDHLVLELKEKIANSSVTIEKLRKQEEENALHLAQTKQAIYTELEQKESEVKKLQESNKQLQQLAAKKEIQQSGQSNELKELKEKLKQTLASKQELDAKVMSLEHLMSELKAQFAEKEKEHTEQAQQKDLMSKENEQKLNDLRKQNAQLTEMLQRHQNNEVSFAEIDNELNRTKNENDIMRTTISENERKIEALEKELTAYSDNIKNNTALNAETAKLEDLSRELASERLAGQKQLEKLKKLETEFQMLSEQNATNENAMIVSLKAELQKSKTELCDQLNELKDKLVGKEKELKATTNKINKQKKQHDSQQQKILDQNGEIELLKNELNKHDQHLQTLQSEASARELEKTELQAQIGNILHEISQMEEQMQVVQRSHDALELEKRRLELSCENLQAQTQESNESAGQRLQSLQSENAQLAEKLIHLEKLLAEKKRQERALDETNISEMRLELETAKDANEKLTQKLSQVLDENSRMHNAQELNDHDFRTLQDKYDALEKEKLLAQDAQKCMEAELTQLRASEAAANSNINNLLEQLQQRQQQLDEIALVNDSLTIQLAEAQHKRVQLENDTQALSARLNEMKATQSDDDKLSNLLQENQQRIVALQIELEDKAKTSQLQNNESERQQALLTQRVDEFQQLNAAHQRTKDELELLRLEKAALDQQLTKLTDELKTAANVASVVQEELVATKQQLIVLEEEKVNVNVHLEAQKSMLNDTQAEKNKLQTQLADLRKELEAFDNAPAEIATLKETAEELRTQLAENSENHTIRIAELEAKISTANADVEKLQQHNELKLQQLEQNHQLKVDELSETISQLQTAQSKLKTELKVSLDNAEKLKDYEQSELENEYLQKHVKQLENTISNQKEETQALLREREDHKEKLKSVQCELYVLSENAAKHSDQLIEKESQLNQVQTELTECKEKLTNESHELAQQTEHAKFITQQNDVIQRDLLQAQQQLAEMEQSMQRNSDELAELKQTTTAEAATSAQQIASLTAEVEEARQIIEDHSKETSGAHTENLALQAELNALREQLTISSLHSEESAAKASSTTTTIAIQNDAKYLRQINAALQTELEDLKYKSTAEISNLQEELEDMQSNAKHTAERIMELERLRAGLQAQQLLVEPLTNSAQLMHGTQAAKQQGHNSEKDELEEKLKTIMHEVQDVSNRNLFLEQQCENYLILEQSNERLKLQNSKLSRQLDETLVSMQHSDGISANTEFEYLKNIMFQYLTGTASGNNETLVKVISAVLKFSPQQTQVALEKEHQRRSLLNKIL